MPKSLLHLSFLATKAPFIKQYMILEFPQDAALPKSPTLSSRLFPPPPLLKFWSREWVFPWGCCLSSSSSLLGLFLFVWGRGGGRGGHTAFHVQTEQCRFLLWNRTRRLMFYSISWRCPHSWARFCHSISCTPSFAMFSSHFYHSSKNVRLASCPNCTKI